MKKKLVVGISISLIIFVFINIYLIANLEIKQITEISFVVNPDKNSSILSLKEVKKPESTLYYLDSIKPIIESTIPIYFYELPFSYNLAYSKREYPGIRHTNRFLAFNKGNWEADFLDKNEEHHLISEKSIGVNSLDNHRVALNDSAFQYVCDYFIINVKFSQLSLLDKTKWFLRSEYGL
jgi:hypothetical protein